MVSGGQDIPGTEKSTQRGREREGGREGGRESERECGSARPARSIGSEIRLKRKQ